MIQQRALSLVDKLNQKKVQDRIKSLYLNKEKSGPWVIELDPTTACNLACHDCISANLLNQGGIESERLLKLASKFKEIGVKAVVLIGGGEPMAHKEFGKLVEAFAAKDIHIGVTTNGTLINRYLDVCVEYLSWLRVSVDAGSSEIFQQFRPHASGKSQFDLVISNMKNLAKKKRGILGYSFLLLSRFDKEGKLIDTNAVDIEKAGILSKEIGCDYFEVKPAFDLMHYLQQQDRKVADIANKQLENIKKLNSDTFKVIAPYTLEEALKGATVQAKDYERCLVSEMRTVVSPSGVYVCPYHRGNLNMRIGDIHKESFKDIWFGQKRKQVMARVNPKIHCGFHCIRDGSNKYLEKVMSGEESLNKNPNNKDYDRFI
jgi:MoaA/NifB/PqqE/SkfB family radical SAM enzyme